MEIIDWSRFDPSWTEQEFSKGGARDDLGIETLSESILADLLPGINNQTRRARYYSFWAWALHGFIQDPKVEPHTQAKFWEWLRGREDTLILAYLAHNCGTGLAGTTQALIVWNNGEADIYPINWKSLLSVEGGSYQLYYRGALEEMNIIVRNENSPHDDLSREIGVGLAEAYDVAVAQTHYVSKFLNSTQITREDIDDYARTGCICQVGKNEIERQRLVEAFFRFDTPDMFAVKRLASLGFILDLIHQSKGASLSEEDIRCTMYFWSFGTNHLYKPEGNLLEPAQRWRIFQLRQYFVYFIEGIWSLFLHRIQAESLSPQEYLEWLIGNLDLKYLSKEWGIDFPQKDLLTLKMKDFYLAIQKAIPDQAWQDGKKALGCPLNEQALMLTIRSDRSRLDVNKMAGSALIALAVLYYRVQPWMDSSGWTYLSDRFAAGRLPLESHLRQVEVAFSEDWSVLDWLQWLHQHNLWLQHRKVALEKLVTRRQEAYKFDLETDETDSAESHPTPRFRGLDIDIPVMNGPRFPSAMNILEDLVLVESKNDGYRLTSEGQGLLEKFRTYKVPPWKESQNDQTAELAEEISS